MIKKALPFLSALLVFSPMLAFAIAGETQSIDPQMADSTLNQGVVITPNTSGSGFKAKDGVLAYTNECDGTCLCSVTNNGKNTAGSPIITADAGSSTDPTTPANVSK